MERQGAEVVTYDLSENHPWAIVPFAKTDYRQLIEERKNDIRKLNNSYWLNHRAHQSHARVVYGTVYAMVADRAGGHIRFREHPAAPAGSVPGAVQRATPHPQYRDCHRRPVAPRLLPKPLRSPAPALAEVYAGLQEREAGRLLWILTPEAIIQFLGVLGFEETALTYRGQPFRGVPPPRSRWSGGAPQAHRRSR
jgi:hypothetical protein